VRVFPDAVPVLWVYLESREFKLSITDSVEIKRDFSIFLRRQVAPTVLGLITRRTMKLIKQMDYQLAAYCASDLWC